MDIFEVMANRRSCRKFSEEKVARAELEKIVLAGQEAPTAMNKQNLRFTVLRKQEDIAKLQTALAKALDRPDYLGFYNAPNMILVSGPKDSINIFADTGCAMQNMMLAASALGLGSCWINQFREHCEHEAVRDLLKAFKIPEDHFVAAGLVVGKPQNGQGWGERANSSEVQWIE
ncbi:MAG: nitroreductase family protein [Eubacteriales bacterium]|nr:nitroreductase family protein [Eubacteriales bacterium]